MSRRAEKQLDIELNKLADEFKDTVLKEPSSMMERLMKLAIWQELDRLPVFTQIHDHSGRVAGVRIKELCKEEEICPTWQERS
jgi:hypothetical protein